MRPLLVVGIVALSLLCAGCKTLSLPGRFGGKAPAAAGKDGKTSEGFGNADTGKPAAGQLSKESGTGTDDHSKVQSKTPDGGMSETMRATNKPPPPGTPVADGAADTPGADDAKGKGAADVASAATGEGAGANTQDAVGNDGAGVKPEEKKPINGSDPSIGRQPSAPSRKRT